MKKLIAIILTLALACAALPALAADGMEINCKEMQFTTKAPAGTEVRYEEGNGLRIYTKSVGNIPYVQVYRRTLENKFKNPTSYLNNVIREYLEDKYGDDSLGMNPAKTWEVGGKELLGARYYFRLQGTKVTQIVLIEIRDGGDVQYDAKFYEGNEDITMAALEEAVRNYQETDITAAQPDKQDELAPKPIAKAEATKLLPIDTTGQEVDLSNGMYRVHITDIEHINDGGCFTIELYEPTSYSKAGVEALKVGDQVEVYHRTWTIAALEPQEDGELRVIPEEEFGGYMAFRKSDDGNYISRIGDWYPMTFMTDAQVMLPFPNDFTFIWADANNDTKVYDADEFIRLLTNGTFTNDNLMAYNTIVTIKDGMVYGIAHTDNPVGPREY